MSAPVPLRSDFDAAGLRKLARGSRDPDQTRRLLAPAKSPELNPVQNIWQFMRDNWLSNRVFKSYDDILDHCCFVAAAALDAIRLGAIGFDGVKQLVLAQVAH